MNETKIVFFGGEPLAVPVLDEMEKAGLKPLLVVCNPDRQAGRSQRLTSPSAKVWAEKNGIEVFQPESLLDSSSLEKLSKTKADLFVVAAYSHIIPKQILTLPKHGTVNLHPSLLPKYRGPSPIRSAILHDDRTTGVTIMLMDEEVDHGPVLAQEMVTIPEDEWPMCGRTLDARLAKTGALLLVKTIPEWLTGVITPEEQEHEKASYTEKVTRADGEINLDDDSYQNFLKVCAYDGWPGTFFFIKRNGRQIRVKIIDAGLSKDGDLVINRVIPEGKQEMNYSDFMKNGQ